MAVNRFEVYLVNLDPTAGSEIQKTRPCLVVSPDEMNQTIRTVIVAPKPPRDNPTRRGSPAGSRAKMGLVQNQHFSGDNADPVRTSSSELLTVTQGQPGSGPLEASIA